MIRLLVLSVLLLAHPTLATAASTYVGKSTAVYQDTPGVGTAIPTMQTTLATLSLPSKYRSKKNLLNVSMSAQVSCSGESIYFYLYVDGNLAVGPNGFTACAGSPSWTMSTIAWTVPSEALGGTPVADGATIELRASSSGGTAVRGGLSLTAVSAK